MIPHIEYFAGFFDGEGCISVTNPKRGIRVMVTNTNHLILEQFQKYFGEGKITQKIRGESEKHRKPCYIWQCWNRGAEKVLRKIEPYLRLKREEALLALAYCETMGSWGKSKGSHPNTKLDESVLKFRLEIISKVRRLKEVCAYI